MHADRLGDGQPASGQDLQDLQIDLVRLARAAVGLGIRQAEQAGPADGTDHVARELAARLEVRRLRRQFPVGDLLGQPEQLVGLIGGQDPVDRHAGQLNGR